MIKYYKSLGYDCGYRTEITVNQRDLSPSSSYMIEVECDYCHTTYFAHMSDILRHRREGVIPKDCCKDCLQIKAKEALIKKYGANPMKSKDIREKTNRTVREKYNVDYITQSEVVKEKIRKTNLEKYGCTSPIQNKEINEKKNKTMIERYGVENPTQNQDILNKSIERGNQTKLERYGTTKLLEIPGIRELAISNSLKARAESGVVPTSKNQKHLSSLYNASLNRYFEPYFVDMFLVDTNIYIEYDGSGHDLSVKTHHKTQEEFDIASIIRYKNLKERGLYMGRIIHTKKKKLPKDELLLKIKELFITYLILDDYNWVIVNLDDGIIRTKYWSYNINKIDELLHCNDC